MIDCLSNPTWINPQIDVLLFLQNFRISLPETFDKLFLSVTILGENWLPTLICAITYWCIDVKAGMYLFSLNGMNAIFTHFSKMIACVYRPWVLDNRVVPSALAVPYAKGYSFPSGHSAMSSSVLGGLAYLVRSKKFLCLLLIFLILFVGFSRLWLGVHTPQDVVGGFLIGIVLIFSMNRIINWAEQNTKRYLYLAGIIDIMAALILIYVCYFNHYRIDYVDGEMLVDPSKLIYVTCVIYGCVLGLLNGCFLCRKYLPFNPKDVSVKRRIIRGIVGTVLLITVMKLIFEKLFMGVYDIKIAMSLNFFVGITITLIYPLIFTGFDKLLKRFQKSMVDAE